MTQKGPLPTLLGANDAPVNAVTVRYYRPCRHGNTYTVYMTSSWSNCAIQELMYRGRVTIHLRCQTQLLQLYGGK
jgi:hypothetical protein